MVGAPREALKANQCFAALMLLAVEVLGLRVELLISRLAHIRWLLLLAGG